MHNGLKIRQTYRMGIITSNAVFIKVLLDFLINKNKLFKIFKMSYYSEKDVIKLERKISRVINEKLNNKPIESYTNEKIKNIGIRLKRKS